MRLLMIILAICALATLTGCGGGGGGGGGTDAAAGGTITTALLGGDGSDDGSGDGSGDGTVGGTLTRHNPEPATLALFGLGAAAFALLRRKKK